MIPKHTSKEILRLETTGKCEASMRKNWSRLHFMDLCKTIIQMSIPLDFKTVHYKMWSN